MSATLESTPVTGRPSRLDPARLLPLAWPVYFELLAGVIAGIIDVVWVAGLGVAALGAVTIATTLENALLGVILVVGGGVTVVLSKAVGAKDRAAVRRTLRAAAVATAAATVLVCVPLFAGRGVIARLLLGDGTGETLDLALDFLTVAIPGLVVFFAQHVLDSVFKASGDTRTPMRMAVLTNVVLIVLDPILIFGLLGLPELGVTGAAIATVLARCVALAVTVVVWRRSALRAGMYADASGEDGPALPVVPAILRAGLPISVDFLSRMVSTILVVGTIARFGADPLAAYGAVTKVILFLSMASYALRQAATIVSARARGAVDEILTGAARTSALRLGIVWSVVSAALVATLGNVAVHLLTGEAGVRSAAGSLLPWMAGYLLALQLAVVLSGVFLGGGRGGMLVTVTLIGVGLQAVLAPLLAATGLGLTGVWLAMIINSVGQAGILLTVFLRDNRRREVAA